MELELELELELNNEAIEWLFRLIIEVNSIVLYNCIIHVCLTFD